MGIAPGYLSQMADGKRPVPIESWGVIEKETGGHVGRRDLWPDTFHVIWPDLKPRKAKPAAKAEA